MKYIFSIRAQDYRVVRTFLIVSSTEEGLIEDFAEMQCLRIFES